MSTCPLGVIGVWRIAGWSRTQIFEALYFTTDKLVVVRTAKGFQMSWGAYDAIKGWNKAKKQEETMSNLTVEELLRADENNFVLPYSKIEKIELKKFLKGTLINIIAEGKTHKWTARGIPGNDNPKREDYEKILRTIFKEKLSVSK